MPSEYLIQAQTGLLVSERKWLDFISYSAGLPMVTLRIYPDEKVQRAIIEAAMFFEEKVTEKMIAYSARLSDTGARLIPTERKIEEEIVL